MKIRLFIFSAMIMGVFGLAVRGRAATQLTYTLVVTVSTQQISLPWTDNAWIPFGAIQAPGNNAANLFHSVINDITSEPYIYISLSMTPRAVAEHGWQMDTTTAPGSTPADDHYRFSVIFTQWNRVPGPALGDFALNDVLTETLTACDAGHFAWDPESAIYKGYNIQPGQARDFYVLLEVGAASAATPGNITPEFHLTTAVP